MTYLFFKDESIYHKSKYSILIVLLLEAEEENVVEIQYVSPDASWHSQLPLEEDLKKMEEAGEDISHWQKYRKWQKRKKYNKEEFNRMFYKPSP